MPILKVLKDPINSLVVFNHFLMMASALLVGS
jgi:hypothetical protein